ncbi:MAG: hypothetical protein A2539_01400 [Elusimicrobia bacterium RIFOXYD2_FULL_34_15]|nr:MAG: hypothetical protein A2539_01400 [Elusimicrobia bacterium RIFOXYD2_FULL_34_15]
MNSYFASVEQMCNPALRGKPVAVCGEGRTIVVTASYEARKFGVKTGVTIPEAKRLCPQLILVFGNLDKYIDTSFKIHKILLEFTDLVEVYSVDECFLDITSIKNASQNSIDMAKKIKMHIKNELGLTCSIGVSYNKLLAKLASDMQKPDGLVEISRENFSKIFETLPIEELCGIGRKMKDNLNQLGIKTAKQLGDASISMLTSHFGFIGYLLKHMGQGIDDTRVKNYSEMEPVKSVGHSHTFPKDTFDLKIIKSYMLMLSEKVGERLRKYKLIGRTVSLMVRYSDFDTFVRQYSLQSHINSGIEIYETALQVFEKILPLKKAVRLLGVSISNLAPNKDQQFLLDNLQKQQKLVAAVDEINSKYGEFTVKPSSLLISDKFGILERCGLIGKYWLKKS